jgi:hypothetical protein
MKQSRKKKVLPRHLGGEQADAGIKHQASRISHVDR